VLFNNNVAGSITAHGREVIQLMEKANDDYWYNMWHLDTELHEKLNLKNVKQIDKSYPVSIYCDTDSCHASTLLDIEGEKITIENWYNRNLINGTGGETIKGHESVLTNEKILNYIDDKGLEYSKVVRIIRHKVSKPKWKLKTKSGKEIIVTNDHSMIVFRNGKKIEVKPSEILKTDKILIVKN